MCVLQANPNRLVAAAELPDTRPSVWMSCPVLAYRPKPFKLKLRFWASRELHPLSHPALNILTQSSAK